jgi:hypothetical protein
MNENKADDLIDYFVGHKGENEMRAKYTHINKIDNKTFYQNYGSFIIEMLNKFIFSSTDNRNYIEEYMKKEATDKNLIGKDGTIQADKLFTHLINPLLEKVRMNKKAINTGDNTDGLFISI